MSTPTNNSKRFKGTGVALVTPFKNGAIDFPALQRIIEHTISGGVDYLVTLGSTGESATLSENESRQIIEFTAKVNNSRLPLVAGMFGHNNTSALIHHIKNFDFTGVDAILSSSPAYNKPTQEGIFQHYAAVADHCPLPIILYNVPGRTSSNILPQTVVRLARSNPKFIAVKEASGDIVQTSHIIKNAPDKFLVLSGDDPTTLACIACGGHGVISVIANALPHPFSSMVNHALNNDFTSASRLHLQLLDLHHWLYLEGNPAGVKAALEIQGFCSREVRLPLTPLSEKNMEGLKNEMAKLLE